MPTAPVRGGADCELATDSGDVDFENASSSYLDERITSVFAMAPAVGPAITRESFGEDRFARADYGCNG